MTDDSDYLFKETGPSEECTYGYEPWLFHHPDHLHIQAPSGWISFLAFHKKHRRVDAHLQVHIADGVAVSPVRAPFGSIQFAPHFKPASLYWFIGSVLNRLRYKGVGKLILKNPPDRYQPEQAVLLNTFLLNQGFAAEAEVGAVLETGGDFEDHINAWQKRKRRQGNEAGLVFSEESVDKLEAIYSFIKSCRQERNYKLSITLDTLKKTMAAFPGRFVLFSITHNNEPAAASVAIKVGHSILYNFHSAHPRRYDYLSPVVCLLEGMYNYCNANKLALLDLGTSALNEQPNFGLLDFKLGLGAAPTMKLTFSKQL